jgi:nucleoside-diphosphate-sugar epimerase
MKRLLIIGCGDVALRTIPLLIRRYQVFALVRNPVYCPHLRSLGVIPLLGDLDNRNSLARLAGLADSVLHFAPPPPALSQSASPPKRGGREVFSVDHRTRHLLGILSQGSLPQRFVYISTSGVYGDCAGAWVNETRPVSARNPRAQRRIDAERQIRAWARHHRVNACILRVPGIYAADRLPLERLRAATPAIVKTEDSYTNHIHADDLARAVVGALRHAQPNRIYHISDDSELKMGDYFDAVADAFNRPRPPRLPRAQVQAAVSPVLWSFMSESRRLTNARMKRELKLELAYPTVSATLEIARLLEMPGINNE